MNKASQKELQNSLQIKKDELVARLERITLNVRRGLASDSEERAKELEDSEVVDALGNEAREELGRISQVLDRISAGTYAVCVACNGPIGAARLGAYPYAIECIDCAELDEEIRAHSH